MVSLMTPTLNRILPLLQRIVDLRRALAHAIDYEGLLSGVLVAGEASGRLAEALEVAARAFRKVRAQPDVVGKLRSAAAWLREVTGYDRVMVYRFHPDWHGEVVAEARREDLPPYLGLHYPAEDIPRPTREIFQKVWVRPLPDARSPLHELLPLANPDTGRPLDMISQDAAACSMDTSMRAPFPVSARSSSASMILA